MIASGSLITYSWQIEKATEHYGIYSSIETQIFMKVVFHVDCELNMKENRQN